MRQLHKSGLALRATLVIVIAAVFSACGGGGGPTPNPAPRPLLTISPPSIDFETIRVGSSSARMVTMTNSGTGTLAVTQATLSSSRFTLSGLVLPVYLAQGQSSAFSVTFTPASSGAASGSLSLLTNAPAPSTTVELSGSGVAYQLTPDASSLNFGNVTVASTSSKVVYFTNTGTAALTFSKTSVTSAQFSLVGPALGGTLQPGQSAAVAVEFSPTAAGLASGTLSIISDASDSPTIVALSGVGVTYQLGVSPSSLNFGNVTVASTTTQSVTLSNTGTASLTISQLGVTGAAFSLGGLGLPLTLAPGQSVPVIVTFAPSGTASASGSVSIVSSASATPVTVELAGVGVTYQLSASAGTLSFGNVAVSTKSAQSLSLTNTGTGAVTISQTTVSGAGFSLTGVSLPVALGPGQSTTLNVAFAPTQAGSVTGAISVVSNASGSPLVISLAGTGAIYQLTPGASSFTFGNVEVASSGVQTITLTNTGTASLTISQIILSGTGFTFKSPALPVTLAPGQSISLTVSFSPTSTGSASGAIFIVSGASGSPLVLALSGTGQTYQLTVGSGSSAFGSVTVGQNAVLPTLLTSTGTGSVTISGVTVTGEGFTVTDPGLPLILAPGQTTSLSVTFAPTAGGAASGTLSVTTSAAGSPITEALFGTGVHVVDLSWEASSSSGVTGYNVYRSGTSGGQFSVINTSSVTGTSFVDTDVTAGQTYYYKTTAIGAGGVESDYSNVVSVMIPSP